MKNNKCYFCNKLVYNKYAIVEINKKICFQCVSKNMVTHYRDMNGKIIDNEHTRNFFPY